MELVMSRISIDIASSTKLIQYHRERCPTTLTLKIDPFHTAHQSCPLPSPVHPTSPPPPLAASLFQFPNPPQAWLYPPDTCWELEWDKSETAEAHEH